MSALSASHTAAEKKLDRVHENSSQGISEAERRMSARVQTVANSQMAAHEEVMREILYRVHGGSPASYKFPPALLEVVVSVGRDTRYLCGPSQVSWLRFTNKLSFEHVRNIFFNNVSCSLTAKVICTIWT